MNRAAGYYHAGRVNHRKSVPLAKLLENVGQGVLGDADPRVGDHESASTRVIEQIGAG